MKRAARKPDRFTAFEAQLREVAGGLRDRFSELARLVEALPRSPRETSLEDLGEDADPDWPSEARAVVLCVMNDYLRPAVRDLLDAADYRPGKPLVSVTERSEEFRQVFDLDLVALGRGENGRQPGRREESR